jgi:hypothetical protein
MTRDEVIALAREAGFTEGDIFIFPDLIVHFAALVAEHEREECAKVCDGISANYVDADEHGERVASEWCAETIRSRK